MNRYEPSFLTKLSGFDFETLESSSHSIFGLSKDLRLIYFNHAWFEFAKNNNGEPGISNYFPLGTPFELSVSGVLRDFYLNHYKKIISDVKAWKHEYECSSSKIFRIFSQDAYPLKNHEGIIIVNSLKVERVVAENKIAVQIFQVKNYECENGLITQCSNCRKTQRTDDPEIWDWVPSLVENMPLNVSHSICPICYDYYWKNRAQK